ncbi:MAG: murein biosynthesis integral membrane protein MurJ [Nitrospirae bacterium]|jgi:putative peptidoglycan lipid II flippase|nr:murein biosynthesis integral membrane protein MurJ [Nitrospirota bacterium]
MTPVDRKGHIVRAAGLMSIATFISRILGYIKDMILAGIFGATGTADAFFVAFRIPNLLRELFAEGSMSSAFIPVLTEYHTKHGDEEAKRLVRTTFTFILVFVGLICFTGIIFSPTIVSIIAPGFIPIASKFNLTVTLTRIMLPFLLFISLASLVMGALNTKRVFFIPTLAPAMLNITIIIIVLLLVGRMTQPIIAVAIGVAFGGFVQFAFQIPSFLKNGYSLKFNFDFKNPGLKKMALLILPATAGMAVAQINIFVSTILASYLSEGSITYLYYSMRLIQFPIGIFGVAMGMAVLPTLSEHSVKGDYKKLRDDFSFSLRLLFFITIPAMSGLIALNEPIVNLLFQRGQFDYTATLGTSYALIFYSLGIWSIVGVRVTTSCFYSMQDTKTPVKVAVLSVSVNILLSVVLMNFLSYKGLALANSLASWVNISVLSYLLNKKLGRIEWKRILLSFIKSIFASFVMGLIGWMLLHGDLWKTTGDTLVKSLLLLSTVFICFIIYLIITRLFKSDEFYYLYDIIKKRVKK